MSRSDVLQLCQDLCTNQADAIALTKFYDEVVSDLGREEWLVEVALIATTAGTSQYAPPEPVIELLCVYYDDRLLSKERVRALEAVNPNWRDERGTPRAYVVEDESNTRFRLYPKPEVDSKDFIFMFGSPLGLDFPEYAVAAVLTELREDLPLWLEMPVAFAILAREFARESDHTDMAFADACKKVSQILMQMVGP